MHRTDANSGHLEPPSLFMDVAGAQDEMDLPTALRSFLLCQWEKAPRTQDIYREAVMALARLQPGTPVKRIRPEDINSLFAAMPWAQATRLVRWKGLRAFFDWCERERIVRRNPMAAIPRPRAAPPRQPPLYTEADFSALLQACRTYMWVGMRDAAILWTLWTTPARVGELCALTVEDIDWQQAVLHFRRAKGGNQYRAVLFPPCLEALDRYLRHRPHRQAARVFLAINGQPMTPHGVRLLLRRLADRSRLAKPLYPHALRHRFGMETVRWGLATDVAAKAMGHRTTKATEIYRGWVTEDIALDEVRRRSPQNGRGR